MAYKTPNYTQVPNRFFEDQLPNLSLAELKVLLVIVRDTIGYHVEYKVIGVDQFCQRTNLSRQSVMTALVNLEAQCEIVKRKRFNPETGASASSEYRLRFDENDGLDLPLDSKKEGVQNLDGDGVQNLDPPSLKFRPLIRNKENKEKEREEKEINPLIPFSDQELRTENQTTDQPSDLSPEQEDLDLDDDVATFCQNAYRRMGRRGKGFPKTLGKSQARLLNQLEESEQSVGPWEFRTGLVNFLKHEDDWTNQQGWPINAYLKNPSQWLIVIKRRQPDAVAEPRHPAVSKPIAAPQHPPTRPGAPGAQGSAVDPALKFVHRWNAIVTACPVDWLTAAEGSLGKSGLFTNQNFDEKFDAMCHRAQAIHLAKGVSASWLHFRWCLKMDKDGVGNWRKLSLGEFDFMAATDEPKNKPGGISKEQRALEQAEIRRVEEELDARLRT